MAAPKPASPFDMAAPKPASLFDMAAPKPASPFDMAAPKPASPFDMAAPKTENTSEQVSPKPAVNPFEQTGSNGTGGNPFDSVQPPAPQRTDAQVNPFENMPLPQAKSLRIAE